MNKSKMN